MQRFVREGTKVPEKHLLSCYTNSPFPIWWWEPGLTLWLGTWSSRSGPLTILGKVHKKSSNCLVMGSCKPCKKSHMVFQTRVVLRIIARVLYIWEGHQGPSGSTLLPADTAYRVPTASAERPRELLKSHLKCWIWGFLWMPASKDGLQVSAIILPGERQQVFSEYHSPAGSVPWHSSSKLDHAHQESRKACAVLSDILRLYHSTCNKILERKQHSSL